MQPTKCIRHHILSLYNNDGSHLKMRPSSFSTSACFPRRPKASSSTDDKLLYKDSKKRLQIDTGRDQRFMYWASPYAYMTVVLHREHGYDYIRATICLTRTQKSTCRSTQHKLQHTADHGQTNLGSKVKACSLSHEHRPSAMGALMYT